MPLISAQTVLIPAPLRLASWLVCSSKASDSRRSPINSRGRTLASGGTALWHCGSPNRGVITSAHRPRNPSRSLTRKHASRLVALFGSRSRLITSILALFHLDLQNLSHPLPQLLPHPLMLLPSLSTRTLTTPQLTLCGHQHLSVMSPSRTRTAATWL